MKRVKMTMNYEDYLDMERSLTFTEMRDIHGQMFAEIGRDAEAKEIYNELASTAAKYAVVRAEWPTLDREEKAERESRRTSLHDSVIVKLNMLARYLKMQGKTAAWRDCLGDEKGNLYDRKRLGDMACYVAFVNYC